MQRIGSTVKRLLVGRPVSSHSELEHRVTKRIALAVFSSDALSSSAYATDVMMVVLATAGAAALSHSLPIAAAVVVVLMIVIFSYRQTVRAYPQGGGGYAVANDNLGLKPAVVVASSLLIDYVLTLAVSVAAGVKALGAAVPSVADNRVAVAIAIVILITLANLRGVKEAGTFFAIPTYGFLVAMGSMIIFGALKVATGNYEPLPAPHIEAEAALTGFLILRAFSSGATALTGVEAIANAAPNFKPPEAKNAAQTLLTLGLLLGFLFIGITFLANAYGADPLLSELEGKPIPSQVAAAVFGAASFMFYAIQFFTALILFLAANTAFAGFPSLASVLARDGILPKAFKNRGDKLAFSNGIAILAIFGSLVLVIYGADELRIIPLYVIGVFTNFTLSQVGLVKRWRKLRSAGWRRFAILNGIGAATTFVVLIIVSTTKFRQGAWQVIILIPVLAMVLYRIHGYYADVAKELQPTKDRPTVVENRVIVLISPNLGATVKALGFARSISGDELHTVAFRIPERRLRGIRELWKKLGIDHPIEATGHRLRDLLEYVRGLDPSRERPVTLILGEMQSANPLRQIAAGRLLLRLKRIFLSEPGVVLVSVPFRPEDEVGSPEVLRAPGRLSILVLVSGMHRATIRAIEYAKSLNPSDIKAITIVTERGVGSKLLKDWEEAEMDIPIEIVDSPYRSILQPLKKEIRSLRPNPNDAVAVVVPEFVVARFWRSFMHGQTALMIKTALWFEPNVVVIDVPYQIGEAAKIESRRESQAEVD
jgi:amino acid transporter